MVDEPSRLNIFLTKDPQQSRNQITPIIEKNYVWANDKIQNKNSFKLKVRDKLVLNLPLVEETKPKFNIDFGIEILYEDEGLLVLNKPSNLIVHGVKSVRSATLVDRLIEKQYTLSTLGGEVCAGLAHRLDKETSGAILIAKNNFTHRKLSEQLSDKTMGRIYLALTDLPLRGDKIIIDKTLARSSANAIKKIVTNSFVKGSKETKSAFVSLAKSEEVSLIGAKFFTDRTHQIKAHLASINRRILGDELYGYRGKYECRIMLHAYLLCFIHPRNGEKIFIQAPLMDDFKQVLEKKFILGELNEKISLESLFGCFDSFI